MKRIVFHLCICGMSDELLSDRIMIDKPHYILEQAVTFEECQKKGLLYISDFLSYLMADNEEIRVTSESHVTPLQYDTVYVMHNGYLLHPLEDKRLEDMFHFFDTDVLDLYYIVMAGGASREHQGFTFTIHSNETIHKYEPHIHVYKNGSSVRFDLKTGLRYKDDKKCKEIDKAAKKIITPFILKNQEGLMAMWKYIVHGYRTPALDEFLNQYYDES